MRGYPVAYRRNASSGGQRGGGFQPENLPLPANDNVPPLPSWVPGMIPDMPSIPKPANDNDPFRPNPPEIPRVGEPAVKQSAKTSRFAMHPRVLPFLRRLSPWLGALALLEDFLPASADNSAFPELVGGSWVLQHTCTWGGDNTVHRIDNGALLPNQCIGLQAITGLPVGAPIPTTWVRLILWNDYFPFGVLRQRSRAYYTRPNAGEESHLEVHPSTVVVPNPLAWPWPQIDPMTLPILQPAPTPRPLPYRVIPHRVPNPYRVSREAPQRGYAAPLNADQWGYRGTVTGKGVRHWTGPISREPPGKGTKERKVIFVPGMRNVHPAQIAMHYASEFRDLLEALYWSAPPEVRTLDKYERKRIPALLEWLWENHDYIDPIEAQQKMWEESTADKIIGMIGRRAAEAARMLGWGHGPQTGPTF